MATKESAQAGPIELFLSADHGRMDALLARSERPDGTIDPVFYAELRRKLLRHIAMEEKILLPDARRRRGGDPLPIARVLRHDHGEIASLLVPSPSPTLCARLREVLLRHNPLEEGPEGLYAMCDALAGAEAEEIVERLNAQPEVPVAPHYDGPLLNRKR